MQPYSSNYDLHIIRMYVAYGVRLHHPAVDNTCIGIFGGVSEQFWCASVQQYRLAATSAQHLISDEPT